MGQLQAQTKYAKTGVASFYADKFEGRSTASGEKFRQKKMTCAHRTLPFGTVLKVINTLNDKTVTVRVNDRGPYSKGRIIDLTKAAAKKLDFISSGYTQVRIEIAGDTLNNLDLDSVETLTEIIDALQISVDTLQPFILIDSGKITFTGFSIQLGFFASKENTFNLIKRANKELKKQVYLQKKTHLGNPRYGVLVGLFESRNLAFKYLTQVTLDYPGAYIVELK